MNTRTMKNSEIVSLLNQFNAMAPALSGKALPAGISLAKNRTIPRLEEAYTAYWRSLCDLCAPYDIDPTKALKSENEDLRAAALELLTAEVEVSFCPIRLETLELCGTGKYDALTDAEVGLLGWMVEEG